ncbi:MAG: hypothetical protein ABSC05_26345 [Candidatus Solibacter sp.]|jgi:hypothetical protein
MDSNHYPSTLPAYGALTEDALGERIRSADLTVLISDRAEESVLQRCDTALSAGRSLLAFFVDADAASVPADYRRRVAERATLGPIFVATDQSAYAFAAEINKAILGLSGRGGWVRNDMGGPETESGNPFFQRFAGKLKEFPVLNERCAQNTRLKRAIATYFLDRCISHIMRANILKFFFESGSSIAFLSEVISHSYRYFMRQSPELVFETNNIVSYLEFGLFDPVKVSLYPPGPPEPKYGATFGELANRERVPPPLHISPRLQPGEQSAVREIVEHFNKYEWDKAGSRGLILMASSGIELSCESKFPGPHVGSYWNYLFKRALLESRRPTVIFLDESKLGRQFAVGTCYSVCDASFTWAEVCSDNPLALACSFSDEKNFAKVESTLRDSGFRHIETERSGELPYSIIASNDKFSALFPSGVQG